MFLEAEEGGDFGGGFGEGEGEFAVVHLLVSGHEEVEVEREVFGGGVKDDANGGAGDLVFAADVGNDLGFHFDGVGTGRAPECLLFFDGGGDAVRAMKSHRTGRWRECVRRRARASRRATRDLVRPARQRGFPRRSCAALARRRVSPRAP